MANKKYVLKYWGFGASPAGSPGVFELQGLSTKKVGGDLPGSLEDISTYDVAPRRLNAVANFEGEKYAYHNNNVYKLSSSGTWDLDFTGSVSLPNAQQFSIVGLYPALVEGKPYLYAVRKGSSNVVVMTRKSSPITAGGNWETEQSFTQSAWSQQAGPGVTVAYQCILDNIVYFKFLGFNHNGSQLKLANLNGNSITELPSEPLPAERNVNANDWVRAGDIEVFNKKVYFTQMTQRDNFGQRAKENYLFEVHGSVGPRKVALINRLQQQADTNTGMRINNGLNECFHRDGLVRKGDALYAIVYASGYEGSPAAAPNIDAVLSTGWEMHKFVPSGTTVVFDSEVTDTVLPQELRRQSDPSGAQNGASYRGRWTKSHEVDESGNARLYLYYTTKGNQGSIITQYEFVDDTQELLEVDTGGDGQFSNVSVQQGGGNYEVQPVLTSMENFREGQNAGTIDIDVRVIGTGQALAMSFLFDKDKKEATTVMQLAATTSGTLINNGAVVSGVLAGDSGNVYTITWRAEDQGIPYALQIATNPIITLL